MKNLAIHHIHVRCGNEIFTVSHSGESVSLTELTNSIAQIASVCVDKYFRDKNIEGA